MTQEIHQQIKKVYFDPSQPGSFGGINALYDSCKAKGLKVSRKNVYDFLKKEEVYTLHKPIRRHYKRNPIIVGDINKQWQADLMHKSGAAIHAYSFDTREQMERYFNADPASSYPDGPLADGMFTNRAELTLDFYLEKGIRPVGAEGTAEEVLNYLGY